MAMKTNDIRRFLNSQDYLLRHIKFKIVEEYKTYVYCVADDGFAYDGDDKFPKTYREWSNERGKGDIK